eukprot:NODE_24_length_41419_cov_0.818780.p17 type:complete len:277 gc:universal NODE_24_length_41419_cov_0.818780:36243-37073(+)
MIVAINKLDTCRWDNTRFVEISQSLIQYLLQIGFSHDQISFVPTSGLRGENIVDDYQLTWYDQGSLLKVLENVVLPKRAIELPFRMGCYDVFKSNGLSVYGKISRGYVQHNQVLLVEPIHKTCKVSKIFNNEDIVEIAGAGDSVIMQLTDIDIEVVYSECVFCYIDNPISCASELEVQILLQNVNLLPGFTCIFYQRSLEISCSITKLIGINDKSSGEIIKKNPRQIKTGQVATISLKLQNKTCVDTFTSDKEFGRFLLRKSGETIANGIILAIIN